MLARQATLKYVAKKHATISQDARRSVWCSRFFATLRFANVLGALAILSVAITLAILAAVHIGQSSEACSDPNGANCKVVASGARAATFIVIAVILSFFSFLSLAADGCRARCVARFFGFMAYNVWKGLFSIFCGLSVSWIGNEYKEADGNSAAATAADIALFIVGMFNVGVGLVYVFFGSCDCIAVESTPLKQEFRDYAVAMRMYRDVYKSSEKTHAEQVSVQIVHPADAAHEDDAGGAAAVTAESNTAASSTAAAAAETPANPFKKTDEEVEENPFKKQSADADAGEELNPFSQKK